jgi:hypothetical protein
MKTITQDSQSGPKDARKLFRKLGTCSRTFFHIVNREFGPPKELEERAADALAGGILQEGHQCGMLWGASLAVGAEAYRTCKDQHEAIAVAIIATQSLMNSFTKNEHTINCRDITHCDFKSKWSFAKYMVSGKFLYCFKMADKWAPDAVETARNELARNNRNAPAVAMSCATEVARKMGATDEEMIMVAGFAGGLGLSGAACGALSAAIWMKSLAWCKEEAKKMALKNPGAKKTLETFYKATDANIQCDVITGKTFKNIEDHTLFIKNGGCAKLITVLATS